ncbi:uncharacterized protein [Centruroides vittatus]|uniref:uncharacterized protein n=1 Tax=Centruroides vittatus TaxID=120091 RepID=UPI0035102A26
MNNMPIKIEKSIKYLGVWIDFRLGWEDHVKYIAKRTTLIFHAFSQIARKNWGLTSDAINIIYDQIYIPIITYGCCSWGNAIHKVHLHRKLISSQRKALILITRAYRTTPTCSLQVLARKPPITEIIQLEYNLHQLKIGTNICTSTGEIRSENYENHSPTAESLPPYINNLFRIDPPTQPDFEIYTDGSGIDESIGCAFVVYEHNMEIHNVKGKLHKASTVFQAELLAIYMATYWIELYQEYKNVHIISDSYSAIQLLRSRKPHPIATRIRYLFYNSTNEYSITWTRGHQGLIGNERADQLAKEAARDMTTCTIYNKICRRSVKKLLYDDILHRWQNNWTQKHNNITFKFVPDVKNFHDTYEWVKPSSPLTQFLTGHGKFSNYLQRFRNKRNALCAICNLQDNIDHYIFECISLETERLNLKITVNSYNIDWPCDHDVFIKNKEIFNAFYKLIKRHETIATLATRD